jgi:hypothetical protein
MQGVEVPETSVDPKSFYANTRRKRFNEKSISSFNGLGGMDSFPIKQSGIIAGLDIKVTGSVVVTLAGGTCATTARWPYDLIWQLILSANGTTNLVSVSGAKLAAYRFMELGDLNDRGVVQGIGGASPGTSTNQGTLSMASETWGMGQNVTAIPSGTYNFELYYRVPCAADEKKLLGAIFAQTQATSLNVQVSWAQPSQLFILTGSATAVVSAAVTCEGIVFSIPYGPDGNVVVPKLTAWHKLIQYNDFAAGTGAYGSTLVGQGVGQLLQRLYFQLWSGAGTASAPQVINDTNFGQLGWMYGGDQTPESWASGTMLSHWMEKLYSVHMGAAGFGVLDFASQYLARDAVDESTATNLQLLVTANNALVSPRLEVTAETLSGGATPQAA